MTTHHGMEDGIMMWREQGLAEGMAKGRAEGEEEGKRKVIAKMIEQLRNFGATEEEINNMVSAMV